MRIYIHSAPEDLAEARQLADLVARQPAVAANPGSAVTAAAPTDAATAQRLIDENQLIVFLISVNAVRVSWLADVAEYATAAIDRGAAKLVLQALREASPYDERLNGALRDAFSISGGLHNLAIQIAYYSTWRFRQSGGRVGFRPTTPPPTIEPEPEPAGTAGAGQVPSAPQAGPSGGVDWEERGVPVSPQPARARVSDADDVSTLHFSAYHPNTVAVGAWHTLIVYTYLAAALAKIEADAATFTELGSAPTIAKGQAARRVEQGVELTVEPHMDGVTFSPERESFIWRGDWRRTFFRFSGAPEMAGRTQSGWIDIYAGPMVPIARIDLAVPFHDNRSHTLAAHVPRGMIVSSNIHDAVFISYSHRDGEAFRQACDEYRRFGITIYTDQQLEAGAHYEKELGRRIAEANVFHLLWSPHSAASGECRKEWLAALQREPNERFIKPWFWHRPLSAPPQEFVGHRISFKYEPLRRSLWRPSTWFA